MGSVQQAHAYVDKGVQQLEKAKKTQKTSRKVRPRFRGGLVFKARRLLYHSTLGRE